MKTKCKDKSGLCLLRSLLLMMVVMCATVGWAKTYTVEKAGTLRAVIGQEADTLSRIKVVGSIDTIDLKFIGNLTYHELKVVDLYDTEVDFLPSKTFWRPTMSSSIELIILPKGLTTIGDNAFNGCQQLVSAKIPKSIKVFPSFLFAGCNKLEICNFPDSLVEVGHWSFAECFALKKTKLMFPQTVRLIGVGAFLRVASIEKVFLPAHLESIGSNAFREIPNLTEVYCTAEVPPMWVKSNISWAKGENATGPNYPFDNEIYERATLYIPQGTLQAYQEQPHWAKFKKIVEVAPGNWPPEAAVNEVRIDHGAVVSQEYINLEGRISATPFEGVNIVRNRHADGHMSTTKVIK